MKKLMIVLTVASLAVCSQAAAMKWGTGTTIKAPTSATDGTFGTANAGTGTLSLYVWIVDATTYGNTSYDSISTMDTATASASVTGKAGAAGATASWEYADTDWTSGENTTIYGLILTTYKAEGVDMYIANKATCVINGSGKAGTVTNLAKYIGGGTTGTAITGWSTNVPEPTSALLMLLGFAGLALRRKHA